MSQLPPSVRSMVTDDRAAAEITFVAPARLGDDLVAEAAVRARFGRSGLYDVTVRCDDQVIAELRGRSHTLASP